jgi:hypothetical protein
MSKLFRGAAQAETNQSSGSSGAQSLRRCMPDVSLRWSEEVS